MINKLIEAHPSLVERETQIVTARDAMIKCFEAGGKLLLCGNGGSCADCDHISGELLKGFMSLRPLSEDKKAKMRAQYPDVDDNALARLQYGLPAISLPSLTALNTAFSNDVDPELIYAQGVLALAKDGDVLIGISTSGNSKSVVHACEIARALGVTVIALTGNDGGSLKSIADVCICAPERETYKVQELHLPIYHALCAEIEAHFFS